jgi:hypothetical protein
MCVPLRLALTAPLKPVISPPVEDIVNRFLPVAVSMIENVSGLIGWSSRLPPTIAGVVVDKVPAGLIVKIAARSPVDSPDWLVKLKITGTLIAESDAEVPVLFVNESG